MSDANSIDDLSRAEHLGYDAGKGVKRVSVFNDGVQTNVATEAKQDDIISAINNVSGLQRSTDIDGGGKVSVGTTAVEATFTGTTESIVITADKDNTGVLYIGKSNVTNLGANAMTFLESGDSITLSYDDATNGIYVVASVAGQYFFKGALL